MKDLKKRYILGSVAGISFAIAALIQGATGNRVLAIMNAATAIIWMINLIRIRKKYNETLEKMEE